MVITDLLRRQADITPDKILLMDGYKRKVSYQDFYKRIEIIASGLIAHGLERYDRVAIVCHNTIEFFEFFWASILAGGIAVPMSPSLRSKKLTQIIGDANPKFLVADRLSVDYFEIPTLTESIRFVALSESVKNQSNVWKTVMGYSDFQSLSMENIKLPRAVDLDPALIIYTSGTTGIPKGILCNHVNVSSAANSISSYLELLPSDKILDFLPPSFDYGLYQIILAATVGASVFLLEGGEFVDQIIEVAVRESCSCLPIVPSIAAKLISWPNIQDFDWSNLRLITSTGARLHPKYIQELSSIFPKSRIYSMYGLSECKRVSYLPPELCLQNPQSVGIPMPNVEVRIIDEDGKQVPTGEIGQLIVRGSNVAIGYWQDQDLTSRIFRPGQFGERWLFTGDYFYQDENALLYFVGRKDDLVKVGERRISTKEIEDVLVEIPGILEVLVIPVSDNMQNIKLKALVVVKANFVVEKEDIIRYCRKKLEHANLIPSIEFVNSLPKNESGKIMKST